ncbi:MAG: DUF1446 domain-containing protein [Proteobacteria bacterium]|nr:DUF1446 domain-containing protein [Pseudomonadota bacterium]
MAATEPVRIGGGSAFFIDSAMAVPQLLAEGVDYILLDYLAEGAMGLLGRARAADPAAGFPSDLLDVHIGPFLNQIAQGQVRVVTNAGGVNPAGLATALRARIAALGLDLPVACISGDDLMGQLGDLAGARDMFNGAAFPQAGVTSANAYLGAFPIAAALARGARIVVTGRVVDSALALGPLIHHFGWQPGEWDRLSGGTLAGHLIECGPQVTGGTFTDWREVQGWATIGAPIAECHADGSCVITKPAGTGGLVNRGTVAEQLLYETGDPQAYIVPDVTCDWSDVRIEDLGPDRVRVSGARGHPAPLRLKACATWDAGWRASVWQPVIGPAARDKAQKQAAALFERAALMLRGRNLPPFSRTEAVLVGGAEEVVMKLVVEHDQPLPVQMFCREQFAAISAMAPGTSVAFAPSVAPMMHLGCYLVDRTMAVPRLDGEELADPHPAWFDPAALVRPPVPVAGPPSGGEARLESLAWARSGEKGETINVGVIARDPAQLGALRAALTEPALRAWLPDLGPFALTVYDLPGFAALNLVLEGALPGGLNASQRLDPAAKSIAQRLMNFPIRL